MVTLVKAAAEPGIKMNSGQWIWALFSLIVVLSLTYWGTRFLAGKVGRSSAEHLKVAESLSLGPNRHLYLFLRIAFCNGLVKFAFGKSEVAILFMINSFIRIVTDLPFPRQHLV